MSGLVLGSRGSALARWQAGWVRDRLVAVHPDLDVDIRIVESEGDAHARPLDPLDRGVFVRSIQRALAEGTIDAAVHSLKDLPSASPAGIVVAAVPARHAAHDMLVRRDGRGFDTLPTGARIGTGSPRRRFQLLRARPDLVVIGMRGNVDTRLGKLRGGEADALVLARAGIERLGIDTPGTTVLPFELCLPAAGQGAIAIETRADDARAFGLVAALECARTRVAVDAERACLAALRGGCLAPIAVHARIEDGTFVLTGRIGSLDGARVVEASARGTADEADTLARSVARRLLDDGAASILARARETQIAELGSRGGRGH